jgi:hypothetical protein
MRLDEASWRHVLAQLPVTDVVAGGTLAVAFVNSDDFAAKRGPAWLWWPGSDRPAGVCAFDGRFPADWGMLLVMSEPALDSLCSEGESSLPGLVRKVQIRPFVLQQMDLLEAAGLADFVESLELATPKH